ncbi:putative disease resistance protein At3g14460 [Rhododendron vialii]|uniref:putative disease resistance protein At3g14460 n=1 Tax=Rhododendron vialii TaxID=182163 RepID=UPI00265D8ABC|nr:putative disease resistance protein At3g14460 [Rhododendron vialii]
MHTLLPSLHSLILYGCPEIESFSEGGLPSKLDYLSIGNCEKLVGGRRDWGLQALPSLTCFSLKGESEDVLESFPEEGLLPPTLTYLCFRHLVNLKSLNGRGLQPLVSLEEMYITDCPQLQSLSVERLPISLSKLEIWDCPLVVPRCRRAEGEDWHKIAHIPHHSYSLCMEDVMKECGEILVKLLGLKRKFWATMILDLDGKFRN